MCVKYSISGSLYILFKFYPNDKQKSYLKKKANKRTILKQKKQKSWDKCNDDDIAIKNKQTLVSQNDMQSVHFSLPVLFRTSFKPNERI